MFQSVLGDSDKLEKSRLEILKNPEMALALGFTDEQVEFVIDRSCIAMRCVAISSQCAE
jgi:hypothetical protein